MPRQTAAGKIGLINTRFFDADKDGITKYVIAMDSLEKEFAKDGGDLKAMELKLQNLEKEIQTLREALSKPNSPVKPETARAKVAEYERLALEYDFKKKDIQARIERREPEVMGPVRQDISKAMEEFAKKNGYTLIFDISKLDGTGLVLAIGDAKIDVTKEFITFFNARPATAATTATK